MNIAKNHLKLNYIFSPEKALFHLKKCNYEPEKEKLLLKDEYTIKNGTYTHVLRKLLAIT